METARNAPPTGNSATTKPQGGFDIHYSHGECPGLKTSPTGGLRPAVDRRTRPRPEMEPPAPTGRKGAGKTLPALLTSSAP
jgi:hypothetical protein